MSEKPLKIAIAGCGKVAHLHAKASEQADNVTLVAAWSRRYASAQRFASEYAIRPCRKISKMVTEYQVDLVIICTPHPFHLDPCVEAAKAGAHILVEKPLASTLEDCDTMIEACKAHNVKLGVISQRRWYPPVWRMKEAIAAGKIGKPVIGTVSMLGWRDRAYYEADAWRGTWDMEGGGVLVNQAPHQLDIFLWYMGEIDELVAIRENVNHPYIEVEDTALAILRFKSGAIGNIIVSNSQKPGIHAKIHVHGENGASVGVQTEGGAMFIAGMSGITEPPEHDIWTVPGETQLMVKWNEEDAKQFNETDPLVYYFKCQIEDFRDAVKANREPLVNGLDGRRTVELFTGIYRSNRDRSWVKFPLQPETGKSDMDGRI